MEWHRFEVPISMGLYELTPGVQVEVEYTTGLASNPQRVKRTLLVGEINVSGGLCDCCSLFDGVVLAERVLVTPGLLKGT